LLSFFEIASLRSRYKTAKWDKAGWNRGAFA